MRYHGNYCGPNWSNGKIQPSVVGDLPPIDEFDDTCRTHDAAYANNSDLANADLDFFYANIGKGVKRSAAAVAVGFQGGIRAIDKHISQVYQSKNKMTKPNLRGSGSKTVNEKSAINGSGNINVAKQSRIPNGLTEVSVPASFGTVVRGVRATQSSKTSTGIIIDTTVCIGRPGATQQNARPELVALQYLSPVQVGNDEIQNMTRVYQHFRILSADIYFRALQGTSTGGEVMIVADDDPNYRPIDTTTNSTFYQRALGTSNSVLTPIWMSTSMPLPVDKGWKVCDNSNSSTLEDFCSGVVYIYSDANTALIGYLVVRMKVEFEGFRFNSRNLISGSFLGMGLKLVVTFVNPVLNAPLIGTAAGLTIGDIYTLVLTSTGSTQNYGTLANQMTLSSGGGSTAVAIDGSFVVYARATSTTQFGMWSTFDAACGSDNSDQYLAGSTSALTNSYPLCIVAQVRNSTQPTL